MNIDIREIKDNNLDEVAVLDGKVWLDAYNKNFTKKFLKMRLENAGETAKKWKENLINGKEFFIGAFDNDKLVGYASFKKSDNLKHINDGMITNLFILSEYQDKGIGTMLFKESIINIKEKFNKQNVIFNILKGNSHALRFFKSFGADIIGTTLTTIDNKSIREYLLYLESIDKTLERIDKKEFIK